MATIRLSGTVLSEDHPHRARRTHLLQLLDAQGWQVENSNGDQRITLSNIEQKIIASDAFLFMPSPTIEDMFKAISIFVGFQTLDPNLAGKPAIILNPDDSWRPFLSVLDHLRKMGTVKENHEDFLLEAHSPEEVLEVIRRVSAQGALRNDRSRHPEREVKVLERPLPPDYLGSACVFCSASLQDPHYLEEGEAFGRILAQNNIGCVSGAGSSGIMGAVVKGAVDAGGWAAGSNVPHIIELEGLPDGLSTFWPRPDIYTRMEVMIENSDAFVILPGGAGTMQELLALMIFKHRNHPLMAGKPVAIFNRPHSSGLQFWDPLIDLLSELCQPGDFVAGTELDDLLTVIRPGMKKARAKRGKRPRKSPERKSKAA